MERNHHTASREPNDTGLKPDLITFRGSVDAERSRTAVEALLQQPTLQFNDAAEAHGVLHKVAIPLSHQANADKTAICNAAVEHALNCKNSMEIREICADFLALHYKSIPARDLAQAMLAVGTVKEVAALTNSRSA